MASCSCFHTRAWQPSAPQDICEFLPTVLFRGPPAGWYLPLGFDKRGPVSMRILQLNESPVLLLIRHPSKLLLQEPNPRCSVTHSLPSFSSSPPLPVPLVSTTPTTLSPVPALTESVPPLAIWVPPPPINATPAVFNAAIQSNP